MRDVDDPREKVDEAQRTVARGRWEGTPFAALGGVGVVALGVAGTLAAIVLVVWFLAR